MALVYKQSNLGIRLRMERKRRARTTPMPCGKLARLSDRQLAIIALLSRYRYLDAAHLYALLGSFNSNVRKALTDLFHEHRLVHRLSQRAFLRDPIHDSEIYELSGAGWALAATKLQTQPRAGLNGAGYGASTPSIHNLLVCHAVASIEAAANASGLRFISCAEILARAPAATRDAKTPLAIATSISRSVPQGQVERASIPVIPDAIFALQYPSGGFRCFFVELDRGTMPISRTGLKHTSFERKLLQYRDVLVRGSYKAHLGMTATPLLVLTITPSNERVRSLKTSLEALGQDQWSKAFLFKAEASFAAFARAPRPALSLLTEPWSQVNDAHFCICNEEN